MTSSNSRVVPLSPTKISLEEIQKHVRVKRIRLKRLFDLFFALTAAIVGFPIFLAVAVAVKLSSPGPLVYSQERIGRGGKPFACYKFRSMYPDADQRLKTLLAENAELKKEWEETFKLKEDPRVTKAGKFLRKTSLDELPQFWNVLKGDLSVVGPRPVVRKEVELYFQEKAIKILSVKPGLTCLWQTSGRSDVGYAKRIALDEEYVDRQSFWLDLTLIFKTLPAMLFSKGAY